MGEPRSQQFDNIYYGLNLEAGVLKLAPIGLGWKTSGADSILTVSAEEFRRLQWLRVARNYQLRIQVKNGDVHKFDGFLKEDYETLRELSKVNYRMGLEVKELSIKGWNWGKTDFQGTQLLFNVSNKTMFEIPLSQVANTNLASRNEVSLEFMQPEQMDEDAQRGSAKPVHELVEMRFYIPGIVSVPLGEGDEGDITLQETEKKTNVEGAPEKPEGEDPEDEEVTEEMSAASVFHEIVKEKADLTQVSGEGIVLFSDILLLTPRGRYDIDMFSTFLRLRGKTYDYKIQYSTVMKLFLLPKMDDIHVMFVVGLDPPLRQGQTRYPFLVMQFTKDFEAEVELNLDKKIEKTYNNKLEEKYDTAQYEIVSTLFKVLTQRKVTIPGTYRSHHANSAIKCSMKANEGYLYPLEKCFLFIPKPPTFIPIQDIKSVTFSRVAGNTSSARTFDLKFNMNSGAETQFSSINREEYKNIEEWMKSKNIQTNDDMNEDSMFAYKALEELADSDEEEEVIPVTKRRGLPEPMDLDNEDESVDEDFVADESESDVAEEYDEEYRGSQTSSDDEKRVERPKKKLKASGKTELKSKSEDVDKESSSKGKEVETAASSRKGKEVEAISSSRKGKEVDRVSSSKKGKEPEKRKPGPKLPKS
ncbi:hypothetical protein G9A89_014126 [Geosiphon pyriformis]|nr:hypothetical protein G9A89_014126 [Geosiphon pyriformis]